MIDLRGCRLTSFSALRFLSLTIVKYNIQKTFERENVVEMSCNWVVKQREREREREREKECVCVRV